MFVRTSIKHFLCLDFCSNCPPFMLARVRETLDQASWACSIKLTKMKSTTKNLQARASNWRESANEVRDSARLTRDSFRIGALGKLRISSQSAPESTAPKRAVLLEPPPPGSHYNDCVDNTYVNDFCSLLIFCSAYFAVVSHQR